MKSRRRASLVRLGLALLLASTGACGATDCGGCLAPLDHPFPEANKFNRAAQVRMTPAGVNFLDQQLPTIIQSFASIPCDSTVPCPSGMACVDGVRCERSGVPVALLGFEVPNTNSPTGCYSRLEICSDSSGDNCLAYMEMLDTTLAPTAPSDLHIDLDTSIWSTWIPTVIENDCSLSRPHCCVVPAPDCKIRITQRQRKIGIDTTMRVDNPLQRLEFAIGDPSLQLDSDDIEVDGGFVCDVLDFIMPVLFPLFRGTLTDTLNDTVKDSVYGMTVESCAPPAQCNQAVSTYCDGDQRCRFGSNDRYVPALLGVEGGMDLGALLGEFAGNASEPVGISAAAGGYAEVVAEGIEIGLRGGTEVSQADCAPPVVDVQPTPPRYSFGNSVAHPATGADTPFMLGMVASDRLLEETMAGAVSSGALCQRVDSGLSSYINTGALGLLASSLGRITRGGAKPALIEILPRRPLTVDLGLGTTMPDPNDPGRTILDEPLITLRARDLDLDLYGLIDDRYTRFMTMRVELVISIGLVDDGLGNLLVVLSGPEDWLHDVQVINSELLTDDPADIEAAVPSLIGTMLGQFAPDLTQTIAVPDMMGFTLEDLVIRGVQQRVDGSGPVVDPAGNPVYEFLGVFANLSFDPAAAGGPLGYVVDTEAQIHTLELPPVEAFSIDHPGGPVLPELQIAVAVAGDPEADAEYSYRVDGGFWRPFHHGDLLHVTDPALQLMGRHRVEIRGRLVDAPATLDPEPVEVEVLIDPLPPTLALEIDRASATVTVRAEDAVSPAEALVVRHRLDDGDWQQQQGLAPIALAVLPTANHRLEVEVIDEAGQVARQVLGALPPRGGDVELAELEAATPRPAVPASASGCGCAGAPTGGSLLAGLLLLGLRRRRRG